MYLARLQLDAQALCAALVGFAGTSVAAPVGRPRTSLAALLASHPRVDAALRFSEHADAPDRLVILSAPVSAEAELQACHRALLQALAPAEVWLPAKAAHFDALTAVPGRFQLRVDTRGYRHRGQPLGCDFKLASVLQPRPRGTSVRYQISLRRHLPSTLSERSTLKHLAWLDREAPYTEPVRAMQRTLAMRLLKPGWLANEYLACDNAAEGAEIVARLGRHFAHTTGRIGFREPPLERGDCSEWLVTGLHDAHPPATPETAAALGAALFGEHEIDWLHRGQLFSIGSGLQRPGGRGAPHVFISYASNDAHRAQAVCVFLESIGVPCWIAPRDIDRDILPFTEAIPRGIDRARAVVLIHSSIANLSMHIPRELDLAIGRRLPIIPVRLEEVLQEGQLRYQLSTCQWLNAYAMDWDAACRQLAERLHAPG